MRPALPLARAGGAGLGPIRASLCGPTQSGGNEGALVQQPGVIPVDIDGQTVLVEASLIGGEEEIAAFGIPSFGGFGSAVRKIAGEITKVLKEISPDKASVEFAVDLAVEAGQLTALLVSGSASGSLKITLEWGSSESG